LVEGWIGESISTKLIEKIVEGCSICLRAWEVIIGIECGSSGEIDMWFEEAIIGPEIGE
jgi:hypothetical protein